MFGLATMFLRAAFGGWNVQMPYTVAPRQITALRRHAHPGNLAKSDGGIVMKMVYSAVVSVRIWRKHGGIDGGQAQKGKAAKSRYEVRI